MARRLSHYNNLLTVGMLAICISLSIRNSARPGTFYYCAVSCKVKVHTIHTMVTAVTPAANETVWLQPEQRRYYGMQTLRFFKSGFTGLGPSNPGSRV